MSKYAYLRIRKDRMCYMYNYVGYFSHVTYDTLCSLLKIDRSRDYLASAI